MFRSFIYLDESALSSYSRELGLRKRLNINAAKVGVRANIGVMAADAELAGEKAKDNDSYNLFDEFEKKLGKKQGDDFFDFITDDYDAKTLPPMSIIRFRGNASMLEGFDMLNTFKQFAPMFKTAGIFKSKTDDIPTELVFDMLEEVKADVPIELSGLETNVFSKLKTEYLFADAITDIEDLEDSEAVFLCKVEAYSHKEKILAYEPLKDFMKFGRSLRRNMDSNKGLEPIYIAGPAIKVETIAIYH